MKQEVPPGVIFGAIAAAVLLLGFLVYKGIVGDKSSAPSDMGMQLSKVIARTGGDVRKMTPEEKKVYDQAVTSGYYRPGGSSGSISSSGQPNVPGTSGSFSGGRPPGVSGSYPGSSYGGRPPGVSGSYQGSYPGSSGGYPAGSSGMAR
jgi:hypothetical protein